MLRECSGIGRAEAERGRGKRNVQGMERGPMNLIKG